MEKFSVIQGHYSNMEKRNFCQLLTILAVVYGWSFTGCRNDDASYQKITQVELSEDTSVAPDVDEKPTVEIKPSVNSETVEKPKNTNVSQAAVDSSQKNTEPVIQVSKVEDPEKKPLKDKNQSVNTNQPVEKQKPSNPQGKSKKLPEENKTENIKQEKNKIEKRSVPVNSAERLALLQNRNNPDKKIKKPVKREVKILIPDKKFKATGKNKALRVSYDDIDLLKVINMEPVTPDVAEKMPQWLLDLDGKKIRIRGFMFPTYVESGIEKFALARDNDICCFISTPKIYDVFTVLMRKGVTTNYIEGRPFDVEGVFHIKVEAEEGIMLQLYFIDDAIIVKK
jgi:hypothetical protein